MKCFSVTHAIFMTILVWSILFEVKVWTVVFSNFKVGRGWAISKIKFLHNKKGWKKIGGREAMGKKIEGSEFYWPGPVFDHY